MVIEINGIEWCLCFVEPDDPILLTHDSYTLGVTDIYGRCIYIANNLDDETLYDVLTHELCHAWSYSYGYNISIPHEELMCQVVERCSDDIQDLATETYMYL